MRDHLSTVDPLPLGLGVKVDGLRPGDRVMVVNDCTSVFIRPGMVGKVLSAAFSSIDDEPSWKVEMDCGASHSCARNSWLKRI